MWNTYNTYSNGHGGCCSPWSGDSSPYGPMGSYFCGNSSAGGWVGFGDPRGSNTTQGLSPALPVGFQYDPGHFPEISGWSDPAGAIMHIWRAQGWFVNMFEIRGRGILENSIEFSKTEGGWVKGGWQGGRFVLPKPTDRLSRLALERGGGGGSRINVDTVGRGWQVDHSKINSSTENYLLADKWMIENVKEVLDAPNEYFYDSNSHVLHLIPNASGTTAGGAPDPELRMVAGRLQTLISINSTMSEPIVNITLQGLHFRYTNTQSVPPSTR